MGILQFACMIREFVNVIVTCTARKTVPVPSGLMMRKLRRDRLDRRFNTWSERLKEKALTRTRAIDLYCGNSWSAIRDIFTDPSLENRLRVWVVSAGHGLVAMEEPLAPYAATFSARNPDSVIPPELSSHSGAEWWKLLVTNRRQNGAHVASIEDIAKLYPEDPLVIAVSSDYLKAIAFDLAASRSALVHCDHLVVIAAGAKKNGPLLENYLPCDSRLEHRFGRSRMALNSRIIKSIVSEFPAREIRASNLGPHFRALIAGLPQSGYPERRPTDDRTVCDFIRRNISSDEKPAYTTLLRLFRGSGRACEQSRFRELFHREVDDNKAVERG